jgi:SanA protein
VARGAVQRLLLTGTREEMPYMRARAESCLQAEQVLVDDQAERTWDNLKNARERFGVAEALVVTQRFHLPRALYLADHLGMDAVGVIAAGEPRAFGHWRERLARLRALLDAKG